MDGKDTHKNLSERMGPIWMEIQSLYDGQQVQFVFGGRTLNMDVTITFPADMCAHWALFQVGGIVHGEGLVCMHCMGTYRELGRVFSTYEVQERDSLRSIAIRHGITLEELRTINPPAHHADREETLKMLDTG